MANNIYTIEIGAQIDDSELYQKFEDVRKKWENDKNTALKVKIDIDENASKELVDKVKSMQKMYADLLSTTNISFDDALDDSVYKRQEEALKKLNIALKERNKLETELTKISHGNQYNKDAIIAAETELNKLINTQEKEISQQSQIADKYGAGKQAAQMMADAESRLNIEKNKIIANSKQEVSWTQQLSDAFKNAAQNVTLYSTASMAMQAVQQVIRQSVETAKELDSVMVDLQIVTGDTRQEVEGLISTYNEMASALGSTTTSVAESANEFLRQGLSVTETNRMIEASQYLSKLGMIESSEATQYLTSATKGYQLASTEAMSVVDKLTKVDINAAVSSGYLAEAMARTANSAQQAGVDMDTLIGYIATIGETTQRSASTVGESLKTMFARLTYKAHI